MNQDRNQKASYFNFRWTITLIGLVLFIASLTQDAILYKDYDGQKTYSSLNVFVSGGFAILGGGLFEWFIWLANPIILLSVVLWHKGDKRAIFLSVIALMIALRFTVWHEILVRESGRTGDIDSLKLGYWLWIVSIATVAGGILYDNLIRNKKNTLATPH
ncbi:MAG: hypothetical protein GC178_14390 [Flavobacteriales bacterium]|nr:hypothetical protein [Flavobacteriales bacterium]